MRYFTPRRARIEIIPMIDIMLFLLVFFIMFSLRMIPASGHVTKLPTSSSAVQIPTPKLLVEIVSSGNLYVEGKQITYAQLTELLKQRNSEKTAVTLAGTQTVSLQDVLHVIDAVKAGGATQIALAARKTTF
ncbi:MAG: biopolymer transporter ExbD [Chlorobium sp.]|jgi:biopolymer transport protein ExbD|nr:MAG: biopolymer transporter ExbD [Chlorobium sp.]